MKVLIVGGGSIGKRHLKNFAQLGAQRFGVFDPRPERRDECRQLLPGVETYETLEAAVAGGADLAVICSPTVAHVSQAMACLQAGMHVLLEKPIAMVAEEAEALVDAAARLGSPVLMVGYNYRFSPLVRETQALLARQALGRPLFLEIFFSQYLPEWHPWEDYRSWFMSKKELGGGALLDESHAIDLARALFGEVARVVALTGKLGDLEMTADDYAHLTLEFASGVQGVIHMDIYGRRPRRLFEISGTTGSLTGDLSTHTLTVVDAAARQTSTATWSIDRNDMFLDEASYFLRCVREGAGVSPLVTGADALRTLDVVAATQRSASDRAWVTPTAR
jgi:predicted dehydrogenase